MGNVVGLPQMVIPVQFEPVSLGSPRQQATALGIYALPNEDSKVRCSRLTQQCVSFGVVDPAVSLCDSGDLSSKPQPCVHSNQFKDENDKAC